MKDQPELIRITEANALYGIGVRHLRDLVAKRRIPTVRIGRAVYLRRADIDRLVAEGLRPAADRG